MLVGSVCFSFRLFARAFVVSESEIASFVCAFRRFNSVHGDFWPIAKVTCQNMDCFFPLFMFCVLFI